MANITVTLYWDMDLRKWTTTLNGTTETDPIQGLVQGDIVKFAVRFVQTGVAVVLAAPVFTASGIKADNDFTGSYLIQLSAPVLSDTTLYTFTVNPLNSANLNTFLQTYRNTWCALEIYDSVNGILTTPLELQITPGYSLSGTPTDNVAGVIVVAATKTVTFPQSLTFPSALGTNGFQLTTDGAGALTWAASGALTDGDKGEITVSASGATWTIDNDVVTLAKLAHMATARVVGRTTAGNGSPELLTISGTGSVAMTNTPTLVTPVLGAATATSINGITITAGGSGTLTMAGSIDTSGASPGSINTSQQIGDYGGGSINTSGGANGTGGDINTSGGGSGSGGDINTSEGGGDINTSSDGGNINTCCNGGYIDTSGGGGSIDTTGNGGSIYTGSGGGSIDTTGNGGSIYTGSGGGSIDTSGNGSIGLGIAANRITLVGTTASNGKTATFPNVTGTVAVADTSATATQALFATATAGAPAYRAIATADIATALTTPGAIGGTTAAAGSFTTLAGTSSATLGANGGTGGSLVLRGSTSGSATISTSATGALNLPNGTALGTPLSGVINNLTGILRGLVAQETVASYNGVTLTGTMYFADSTARANGQLTGIGTLFESEAKVGDRIATASDGGFGAQAGPFFVKSIASNTSLTLTSAGNAAQIGSGNAVSAKIFRSLLTAQSATGLNLVTISADGTLILGTPPLGLSSGAVAAAGASATFNYVTLAGNRIYSSGGWKSIDTYNGSANVDIGLSEGGTTRVHILTVASTLAVTSTTTMTGRLTANGGITVVGGSYLLTTNSALTDGSGSNTGTITNAPDAGNPTKWIVIDDNGTPRYIPTWTLPPP